MTHFAEILALGLEDDIPLWEVADDCRAAGLITAGSAGVGVLGEALIGLVRQGAIRVRVGRSDNSEPRDIDAQEAEPLLLDQRRYSAAEEIANDLERVYYVNVDNIVELSLIATSAHIAAATGGVKVALRQFRPVVPALVAARRLAVHPAGADRVGRPNRVL